MKKISRWSKIYKYLRNVSVFIFTVIIIPLTIIWGAYEIIYVEWPDWLHCPRISVGVLPISEFENHQLNINELGKFDEGNEYTFNKNLLATPIDAHANNILEKLDDPLARYNRKIRSLKKINGNNLIDLPIIIVNDGADNLADFELMISIKDPIKKVNGVLDSRIKIVDFSIENMEPKEIFADPELFRKRNKRNGYPEKSDEYIATLPNPEIYKDYEKIGLVENTVSTTGELEGNSFAMAHLKIIVPNVVNRFVITYQIYSKQKFFNIFNNNYLGQSIYLEK